MTPTRRLAWLPALGALCTLLALTASARYGYDQQTHVASLGAAGVLLLTSAVLFVVMRRPVSADAGARRNGAIDVGGLLGLLWVVEIGINNVLAPPLPLRDHVDNAFWAAIAVGILALAAFRAFRGGGIATGIVAGVWSGVVSGLVACATALGFVVFGMRFIAHDPLNVAEWAARRATSGAPTIEAFFAFETMAGALLHLVVLGIAMGAVLGVAGALTGRGARLLRDRLNT